MSNSSLNISQLTENTSQQNKLLNLQNQILDDVVKGEKSFHELLDSLCLCAEGLVQGSLSSVMLLESDLKLSVKSAPSAPQSVIDDLSGLTPSAESGSCGNAVFSGEPTIVKNTYTHSCWSGIRNIAETYKIAACWSYPIFYQDEAIGSFALSSFEHREPNEFQQNILKVCANLVSIILQRKEQEDKLWEMAHYDALTGLPNRLLLSSQLGHAIQNANRNKNRLALMFIDLDNFKNINDSFGHDFGDRVLLSAMKLIRECLREGDIISRHGGDEFLLLLENLGNKMAVETIAKKILNAFQKPIIIDEKKISVQFSIGISLYPDDGKNSDELIKNSDIAMYQAKACGKNNIQHFDSALANKIHQKVILEQQLREALLNEEFELYYQPQYVAESDEIDSLEVLIRWNHPERGMLLPREFIAIAEQSSLISDISIFVFKTACTQGVEWISQGYHIPRIAINFSTSQLTECCAERLDLLLAKTGLPADKIEIEITETLIINRGTKGIDELNKMRSLGVSLAMDDFGTGYSSLSQLKQLPMNKLKIDGSFITNLVMDKGDQTIVKTIIAMGKNLDMKIVAECVETEQQQQLLLQYGCDLIQGYFRCRPVPVSEISSLLQKS